MWQKSIDALVRRSRQRSLAGQQSAAGLLFCEWQQRAYLAYPNSIPAHVFLLVRSILNQSSTGVAIMRQSIVLGMFMLSAAVAQSGELRFVHPHSRSMPLSGLQRQPGGLTPTTGLITDFERAIARQLGVPLRQIVAPRKRVEQMLDNGKGHVLCYYDPAWLQHAERYQWSDVLLPNSDILVVRAGMPLPGSVAELQSGRIGTVLGYVYPELSALSGNPLIVRDDAPDDATNFYKLLAGRTDYLLTHSLFLEYMLRRDPQYAVKLGGQLTLRRFDTRCALARQAPVSLTQFNAALANLRQSGEYQSILARYR